MMWVFSQWWSGRLCVLNFGTEPKQEAVQRCSLLCRLLLLGHFCLHQDSRILSAASYYPKSTPCSPIFFSLAFLTSVLSLISSDLRFKNPSVTSPPHHYALCFYWDSKYLAYSNLLDFIFGNREHLNLEREKGWNIILVANRRFFSNFAICNN